MGSVGPFKKNRISSRTKSRTKSYLWMTALYATCMSFESSAASLSSQSASSTKSLVRGNEQAQATPPENSSGSSDSHLLRNNPLRTSVSANTPSSNVGRRTTTHHRLEQKQEQQQPTRNLPSEEDDNEWREKDIRYLSTFTQKKRQHEEFLQWCRENWGIDSSVVEIDFFEYNDYILAMEDRIDIFYEDCSETDMDMEEMVARGGDLHIFRFEDNMDDDRLLSVTDYPTVSVRGLKAARNIMVGEVVLSIPHHALWTLSNVIDKDPVLSKVMGKAAREQYGWDSPFDEIPLLAVALLYHLREFQINSKNKHDSNSVHGPYLTMLLQQNLHESIPHLWASHKLRRSSTPQVRKIAKAIKQDVLEMYETIVLVLVEEHPNVFGEPWEATNNNDDEWNLTNEEERYGQTSGSAAIVDENGVEWPFSLERFHWAFALINARHWHLPVPEDDVETPTSKENDDAPSTVSNNDDNVSFNDQPPASMPTEEWMDHQREMQRREEEVESDSGKIPSEQDKPESSNTWIRGNSFLAPVADLLNFGPPCTRGTYNRTSNAFEIVATCPFQKGHEITFWYTDACDDVFMANYGFTMPMLVPKCPSFRDEAAATVRHLSGDLSIAYGQLDQMDQQIDELLMVLHDCHCENQTDWLRAARKQGRPPKSPSPHRENDNNSEERSLGPKPRKQQRHRNRSGSSKSSSEASHAIRGRGRRSSKGGNVAEDMPYQRRQDFRSRKYEF